MNSRISLPTISLSNDTEKKALRINYWQVGLTTVLFLVVAGYILNLMTGSATILFTCTIIIAMIGKPIYDLLNTDYKVDLEGLTFWKH